MFATKYPAIAALIVMLDTAAIDLTAGQNILVELSKLAADEAGPVVGFISQSSQVGNEFKALAASSTDIESGVEYLITELEFSSEKAKAVIAALFPMGESIAALIPQVMTFISAVKS
jgi:hypothetical protein